MKFLGLRVKLRPARRTPRGVRGLKYGRPRQYHLWAKSHPSRGAWIEMEKGIMAGRDADAVAPLAGCVD